MSSQHTLRAFATPLLLLLLCAAAAGGRGPQAYKVDETDYTRCDLSEVLQVGEPSAAVLGALARRPGAKAALVVRPHANRRGLKPTDEGRDEAPLTRRRALRQAARDRLHLVRQLGLPPERIRAVVGAPSDWSRAELWLVPPAAHGRGVHADIR